MSKAQNQKRNQLKQARLEIVGQLYKRGYSIRKIAAEVMRRLDLKTCSTKTIHDDIHELLNDWRESRLDNIDDALQLELTRIDDTIKELWDQWEKSKQDRTITKNRRKGAPVRNNSDNNGNGNNANQPSERMRTIYREEMSQEVVGLGDVSYIAEIRKQLEERRKLLGLYSAEKREIKAVSEVSREELEQELRRLKLLTDD